MKFRIRHIAAIFLLLISSAPFIVPTSLMVQKLVVIHEMKEKLEQGQLQTITVAKTDIRWYSKGKECVIHSRFFDVKSVTELNGSLILQGLFDDEETEISSRLNSSSLPLPFEQERTSLIYKFTHFAMQDQSIHTIPQTPYESDPLFGKFQIGNKEDPFLLVFSPPPEV